jgi:hypothetical protein
MNKDLYERDLKKNFKYQNLVRLLQMFTEQNYLKELKKLGNYFDWKLSVKRNFS